MKLFSVIIINGQFLSHPVRVRGLKLYCPKSLLWYWRVAPRAGAWIETLMLRSAL